MRETSYLLTSGDVCAILQLLQSNPEKISEKYK